MNAWGLPNTHEALNISSYFVDFINDLHVSYMKDLCILFCNGDLRIMPSLPRSIIWFRHTSSYDVDKIYFRSRTLGYETSVPNLFDIGFGYLPNPIEE